jgi:hypothetical protein
MATSGTYNFQSVQVELLIREAYERIGILGEFVEPQKLDSAKRSIDLLLLEWMNKSVNLWTLETAYLTLVQGQGQYTLPSYVSDIIQVNNRIYNGGPDDIIIVNNRTYRRQLGGQAQTNGEGANDENAVALNAFDENILTSCIQAEANGNISYSYYPKDQEISLIGLQSNTTTEYSITVEVSQDFLAQNDEDWLQLFVIPPQVYTAGVIKWIDVPIPTSAKQYRIRETGGAILSFQEIYFCTSVDNPLDINIANVSRYEYLSLSNKKLQGRPSIYYLDRQITPILNLWPVPSDISYISYSYKKMIQDVGSVGAVYTNNLEIPSRFYPALVWGLSWMLAIKYKPELAHKPELAQMFQAEYERSFQLATNEDTERDAMTIYASYDNTGYYT